MARAPQRTNEEGLRDDPVDWSGEQDLRVLVIGDSHAFGICSESESFASLLERDLSAARPGRSIDVLNAAQGGFSFFQYLGMLEKCLPWEPHLFVLAVYGGNDFSELAGLASVFGEGPTPHFSASQARRLDRAMKEVGLTAMGQCYTQPYFFEHHPRHVEPLYELSLDLIDEMRRRCDERGIEMITVFIPSPCELTWDPPLAVFEEVRAFLELDDDDLAVIDRFADRFVADVRARDLVVVDLRTSVAALPNPPFWRRDQHMNVDGHRLVADRLLPVVEGWIAESDVLGAR